MSLKDFNNFCHFIFFFGKHEIKRGVGRHNEFNTVCLKVIVFLVVCPFLVVFFFCWFLVKCFYNYLRDLNLKEAVAAVYAQSQQKSLAGSNPPTVYPTDPPQHWDQVQFEVKD